ncbi:sensor histidine kinase [Neobacillus piezotolerans]|uniref:histidine kinase n=1 Tax=Neobacillus piezotolerans TaxID=2259171 RepID=A0A3D8GWQ4_9BACI|nr:ATP-binding protein [Neobacillus piezotolerans]RDU38873.1 sensor histidine kinase [Neobacillus piezotolerans]
MSYRYLKLASILLPTILIGGFEFMRHGVFLDHFSMETGNYIITLLTFLISCIYTVWLFRVIEVKNNRITKEREIHAIYEERERLASELHDSIAQSLFLMKVHMKKGKLKEAGALTNSIDTQLRQAIFNLRLTPDEGTTFAKRIQHWLDNWCIVSGIDASAEINIDEDFFSASEEVILFGIVQEAFTNIQKHSAASSSSLTLTGQNGGWELLIEDNGKGFKPDELMHGHYGLTMAKERAEAISASLDIRSEPGTGTKFHLKGYKNNG